MPLKKERDGRFKIASDMELLVGLSTDFFVEEADEMPSHQRDATLPL